MEIVNGANHLPHVFARLLLAQSTTLLHVAHQVSLGTKLHYKIVFVLRLDHFVRLDDVRMAESF